MKAKGMTFLFIWQFLVFSQSKIIFEYKKNHHIGILKHFLQKKLFKDMDYLTIIPLNFAEMNPESFTSLMKTLHQDSDHSLMLLDDIANDVSGSYELSYLILKDGNNHKDLFNILDTIGSSMLSRLRVIFWCGGNVSRLERKRIKTKVISLNFSDIFFMHPKSSPTYTSTEVNKGIEVILHIVLKNVLVSKRKNYFHESNEFTFILNEANLKNIHRRARKVLTIHTEKLQKSPLKVLSFLKPLSVEVQSGKNSKKSTNYIGVDLSILNILVEKLNSSYTLEIGNISDYGSLTENYSYTRTFRDILFKKTDLNMNRYPVSSTVPGLTVIPLDVDNFCFVVRMPNNRVRTFSLLASFELPVWVALVGAYTTSFIIFMLIKEPHWKSIWFLQSIVSSVKLPMVRDTHRIFWGFWLIFIVLINNVYISIFVNQLIPEKKTSRYNSLASLLKNNFTLLSEVGHFQIDHPALVGKKLTPFYSDFNEINETVAVLTSDYTRIKLKIMYGAEFYVVKECMGIGFVGPLMSTSHLMFKKSSQIFGRITSAGFLKYWLRNYQNKLVNVAVKNSTHKTEDSPSYAPLKYDELVSIFRFHLIGGIISSLVFIYEILHGNLTKDKTKKKKKVIRVFPYAE